MSHENVEIVRRAYEAVNSGNMRGFLSLLSGDVKWRAAPHGTDPGTYAGHTGVGDYFETRHEVWDELRQTPDELFDRGSFVVAAVRTSARGRQSGITVEQEGGHLWELARGKVVRFETFATAEAALAAADAAAQ